MMVAVRWLALVTLLGACDGFRPISEIDPPSCKGSPAVEVYGSLDLDGDTIELDHATLVSFETAPTKLELQDGSTHLLVLPSATSRIDVGGKGLTATTALITTDCASPSAGRFEIWFVSGELSGWWRATSS